MKQWKYFALLAALCNASVGIFTKSAFKLSVSANQVAFYKCLIAFLLLTLFHLCTKNGLKNIAKLAPYWWKIAICAFFGIFTVYFFETLAYAYTMISTVVFVLLGISLLATFIFSYFMLKESISIFYFAGCLLAMLGLFLIVSTTGNVHLMSIGSILAAIAGAGYGLFFCLIKKLTVNTHGFAFLWWFIGFGTLYLSIPLVYEHPGLPPLSSIPSLISLGVIPTLGGYYCTARALVGGQANNVQLVQLAEPVFASAMGFLLFGELMSLTQMLGAGLILSAIYVASRRI